MRVLYGVTGEGMGHATRSKVTLGHLLERGHEVLVVASNRAVPFLRKSFPQVSVVEIVGLEFRYEDGAVDRDGSLAKNVEALPKMLTENVEKYFDEVRRFEPQAVVTDFESFAHLYARRHGLPLLSIDNQAVIHRCQHEDEILAGHLVDFQTTKAFIKAKIHGADHYVVTSFFFPPVRDKYAANTTLVPSILRDAILAAKPRVRKGEHVLVYQTSTSATQLLPLLNSFTDERFVVYGLRRDETVGNCLVKNFSEEGFVEDLASCRAVVANGGLSMIGEALFFGKPIFSVPVRHQFEQVMNARYLTRLGYGLGADELDPDRLAAFLRDADHFARRVASHYVQQDNRELFAVVDRVFEGFASRR